MKNNVGFYDVGVWFFFGCVVFFFSVNGFGWWGLFGFILIVSVVCGFCVVYWIFGIDIVVWEEVCEDCYYYDVYLKYYWFWIVFVRCFVFLFVLCMCMWNLVICLWFWYCYWFWNGWCIGVYYIVIVKSFWLGLVECMLMWLCVIGWKW